MGVSEPASAAFRQQTISGTAWSMASNLAYQVLSLGLSLVLMRLLAPESFGLIGMVTVFTAFAAVFGDLGLSAALIQKQDASEEHYSSVFWVNSAFGLALSLVFVAAAPALARFYRAPVLLPLTALLASSFLINSLSGVQQAILQKRMEFRKLAAADLGALLLSGAVAITLAAGGLHVWSLASQVLVFGSTRTALLWLLCGWRPKGGLKRARIRELQRFSAHTLSFTVANYWIRNADNFLIAKLMGQEELGLYSRAYSLMLFPLTLLSSKIGSVLFPAFSAIQGDRQRIASVYLRIIRVVALFTFPMMIGLLLTASSFVPVVLGPQWARVIPLLEIFALIGMIESIGTLNGSLYLSQGRTGLRLKVLMVVGPLAIAAIAIGTRWGIIGVASAYAVYSLVVTIPTMAIPLALIGLRMSDAGRNLLGVGVCSLLMGLAVWGGGRLLPAAASAPTRLACQVGIGIVSYAAAVALLRVQAARDLWATLREQWQAYRTR